MIHMSRKSIFEKMSENNDFSQDLKTIRELCESKVMIRIESDNYASTLEEFIDQKKLILKWPHRNRCFDCTGIKNKIGLSNLDFDNPSIDDVLTYLEYVANMMRLFENDRKFKMGSLGFKFSTNLVYTSA